MNAIWTLTLCIVLAGTVPALWDISKAIREQTAKCPAQAQAK